MENNEQEIFWTICDYLPEHKKQLRHIYLESRKLAFPWVDINTLKLEDFDAAIQEEEVLVAVKDYVPIGFISWWLPDNFIHSLFIDPDFVGKGVGKALLDTCLARTGRPVTLKCLQANKKALKFYASQGWEIISDGESPDGDFYLLGIDQKS